MVLREGDSTTYAVVAVVIIDSGKNVNQRKLDCGSTKQEKKKKKQIHVQSKQAHRKFVGGKKKYTNTYALELCLV